ncbi:hypothetical protein ABMA28_012527 [Loxostege sticticalis]|uniref:Uncharacterized protein n=1 Tax=Loxostege sticticalis TaxID=481309 RepID=A0ABD0S550_LOXSC
MFRSGESFSSHGEIPNGIPPVLLQNFNAYEILEPKKVNISKTLSEELLIDFENPVETKRTIKKEDEGFTVIDAFQNIYVTPQLVNNKTKTTVETDVDFEDFFRKVEAGKNEDWTKNTQSEQALESLLDLDFALLNKKSESPPKLSNNNYSAHNVQKTGNDETDAYQEELIEEVLLNRTLEKLSVSDIKIEDSSEQLRVLSTPKISNNIKSQPLLYNDKTCFPEDTKTDFRKSYSTPTYPSYIYDKNNSPELSKTNMFNHVNMNVLTPEYPSFDKSHSATTSKISNNNSNNQISLDNINRLVSERNFHTNLDYLTSYFQTDKNESTVTGNKYEHVNSRSNRPEEILNDERILNSPKISNNVYKSQIPLAYNIDLTQKSHQATHDYIKLYPKTDQYQQNNAMPSKNVHDKSDQHVTYGTNVTNDLTGTQPKITENLRKLKSAVIDSQPKSFISDMTTLRNLTINPEKMKNITVQEVIKDNKDFAKNRITKSDTEKLKYTKGPDFHEKSIVLPQLLRQLSIQKQERDAKNNVKKRLILHPGSIGVKTSQEQASVILEPTILMEDCNRERLIALKTRQRLSNLVQNGY